MVALLRHMLPSSALDNVQCSGRTYAVRHSHRSPRLTVGDSLAYLRHCLFGQLCIATRRASTDSLRMRVNAIARSTRCAFRMFTHTVIVAARCQLRIAFEWMRLALWLPSLANLVCNVVRLRAYKDMGWVNARRIVAPVTRAETVCNGLVIGDFPSNAMSGAMLNAMGRTKQSVTVGVFSSGPQPTIRVFGYSHLRPEPHYLFGGVRMRHLHILQPMSYRTWATGW